MNKSSAGVGPAVLGPAVLGPAALGLILGCALLVGCALLLSFSGCAHPATTTTSPTSPTTTGAVGTTSGVTSTTTGPATTASTAATVVTPASDTWTEAHPSGGVPSARSGQSMVYDPKSRKVILFGGAAGGDENGLYPQMFNDTWAYDPVADAWTERHPTGALPAERNGQCMVYDPADGTVILFGGAGPGESGLRARLFNDTWAYDPDADTWTELHPSGELPYARLLHSMMYDPVDGKVILFGGEGGGIMDSRTWAYDPAAGTWTDLRPQGHLPHAREGQALVYDPVGGKVILFGGSYYSTSAEVASPTALFNDTWAYDPEANTWTELKPSGDLPPARAGHSMVYDPAGRRIILFGGSAWGSDFNGTWAYDPAANAWTELHPNGALPPARSGESMVYASDSRRAVLFGGFHAGLKFDDTWLFGG